MQEILYTLSLRGGGGHFSPVRNSLPVFLPLKIGLCKLYPSSRVWFTLTHTHLFITPHPGLVCLTLGPIGPELQVRLVTDLHLTLGTRGTVQ